MESMHRLREILMRVIDGRGTRIGEQELFDELMVEKSRLLGLLHVGGRSQQEQREIESSRTVINGKQVAVNSDFARQAIFLSQQLDCSERYVAELLYNVMAENPNIDPVRCLEVTTSEFHQRRRLLIDCVLLLVNAVEAATAPESSLTLTRLANFVVNQLIWRPPNQVTDTFASKIFREVVGLDDVLLRADNARRGAVSNTVAPSGQGNPTLGYDVLNSRYESLKYERRNLASALCTISRLGFLSPADIKPIVDWLSKNPNHAMTYYMLPTVLVAFDPADPQSEKSKFRHNLINDGATMAYMAKITAPSTEWKDPGLKATILLKWTLFLTEARYDDPSLENHDGFRTEDLETQIWNAVQGDAFLYLTLAVLQLQRKRGGTLVPSVVNTLALSPEEQEHRSIPTDEFKPVVLFAFETLVRSLITHASSELRKIKQRQEDLVLANARTDRTRTTSRFPATFTPLESDRPSPPPRSDISMLYSFIGLLYSALPAERALQFWGSGPQGDSPRTSYVEYIETTAGRLPAFLQWAVWSTSAHDMMMSTALYDMLAGLAKGQQCSELAYNFMARGGGEVIPGSMLPSSSSAGLSVSWTTIFSLLDSWASSSINNRPQQQPQPLGFSTLGSNINTQVPPSHQVFVGPKDVLLAQSFLRLLSTVVTHSVAVRVIISGHAHFRAIPTLVSLIPLGVPLELKGALFETLSAFCQPGAGTPGVEICKAVWTLMERLEVINVRAAPTGPFGVVLPAIKGVEAELEEIEAVHRVYPSTIPFLRLLSTLIHTPKRISLKDRLKDSQPINTIPETLGQPYRLPGIGPFTAFVVDNIFANISNREYSRPSDRWETNDLCLCFIERALASFELESLVTTPKGPSLRGDLLAPLLVHPGYDVMKRMLMNSPLQASILSYTVEGVKGFEKEFADEEPFFSSTIIRVLRIVHRVLEIQDIFLDVLIPLLSEVDSAPIVGTVHPRSYFTRFDQALSFNAQYIPALAAYVAYPTHPELVLLSIKILAILSASNSSTNLATLIGKCSDSERIMAGFMEAMSVESLEDVGEAETLTEQTTGAGAPDPDERPPLLTQATRLAALDLLIQETESTRPYPNVAHFLLFGSADNEQIQDPHALGARRTSIHVLLELLNVGIPHLKGQGRESISSAIPLFISLPALAERCYRVIYQLCTHPRSSDFTTRYLRTQEDFFARQLASVSSQVPEMMQEPYIQVQYLDGSRVITTAPSLGSFLRLRSCIFDLVALDLHILTHKGHLKGVSELLDILFENDPGYGPDNDAFRSFQEIGQSHMRIIEFLQSLMFEWSDSLTVEPVELQFLGQLNLHSCVRKDATGCEIIDRTALLSLLTTAKRAFHAQGAVGTTAQDEQLQREATYILESCVVENHRREIAYSIATGYEAWRRLLDMTLTKCFDRLPHDRRENMLFDLLHILPATIRSAEIEESTAVLLSEAVLSAITKLREDRRQQLIAQSASGNAESGSLPAERLYAILRCILEGIVDSNHMELVRGNLYATLINYVHLIPSPHGRMDVLPQKGVDNLALSLASTIREDSFFDNNLSLVPVDRRQSQSSGRLLEIGSLAVLKSVMERLVATISRDAIDGTEVWKTIAFMLLDALVQLSSVEKHHTILSALSRHGILSNFVRGIKESDLRLLSVLKPDPDDLNPLYVYEAKMSLFIRMSQTRAGAERLLETQLVPILAQCDYLDARPEADQSFIDHDSFLPSAIQRYHQLFMPALQLVSGMLATLGNKHTTITNQALDFLSSHGPTIVILLKNEVDYVPLALLEEVHLLVALCASVLPFVPKSEMLSPNSGFGAIHSAILTLATRLGGRCFAHIIPQSDAEMQQANSQAFGYGSDSKFDINVRQREQLLRKSIVTYVGTASDFTEPEITLVLSPITITPHHDERPTSHFLTTIPTIGDALEALDTLSTDLVHTLKRIEDLTAELASRTHIGVDNMHDVIKDLHASLLQDLDIDQKRALILQELERVRRDATQEARVLLDTIEMLLLLIWRHIQHYTSSASALPAPSVALSSSTLFGPNKPGNTNINTAMRFLATPDPEIFKADVGRKLGPALGRLEGLELTLDSDTLGSDGRNQSHDYIEIMARRLRDSAGLLNNPTLDDGTD